jgi:CO dehydrogenase maturation factor
MSEIKSIAIAGKGGTGKTVVSTLLIRLLSEQYGKKVLAIDADSAMSLPYTLDVEVKDTVSGIRKQVAGKDQLRGKLGDSPTKELMRGILSKTDKFDLLAMGRPEEPGCFCAVNDLLRYGIETLVDDYDITIIDGEAGPEQLNRRVMKSIDLLLVVADMSARSLETASSIIDVAQKGEDGIQIKQAGLVLNRVKGDEPQEKLIEKIGLDVFGCIKEDNLLNSFDREGKSLFKLPADSPTVVAIQGILDKII